MDIKLAFWGAARNVTGSRYLLEVGDNRLLVDCGLYQEREYRARNWDTFPVSPQSIDAVLLTHSHIDHCGLLPKLVRDGFKGKIYCVEASADIAEIMLMDSARLQTEDAEFKRRRHEREGRKGPFPEIPLYTVGDAESTIPLLSPVRYKEQVTLGDGIQAIFHNAGHVFGSSMIEVTISQGGDTRRLLFSGDVGRRNMPIIKDPSFFEEADYIIVESTYGDRLHESPTDIGHILGEVVHSTIQAGGNIIIPSFALERAQEVLFYLSRLLGEGDIPHLMVFLDSPMAINITEVFKNHPGLYDREMKGLVSDGDSPFEYPGLVMTRTADESKALNRLRGTSIIIAGSGMCTGGRIKHHLVSNISRRESTIMFVGYQAIGTLGRQIVEGAKKVRILGQKYNVRARITQIQGFSAHADKNELFDWLTVLKRPPRHVFVTHGEPEVIQVFSDYIREKTGWGVSAPEYGHGVRLE
ncbi:MBL fold metallo-hydrolase RNA specificity domain-containing protein [Chloroflexota bacterium]